MLEKRRLAGVSCPDRRQMSTAPENEFDLEKLFLPSWAQEPASSKQYAQYEGGEERYERREGRGRPPQRRQGAPGRGREQGARRDAPNRPPRGKSPERPERAERAGFERHQPHEGRERRERREPAMPLPEIDVSLLPDEKGVESLARQIKMTGRAFPLFDIAQMILQKPERHSVAFSVKKNPQGQPLQPLFICALDDTLWLNEDEAISHVLKKHFGTFYQSERTATEPPKGKYTFVAQCGISGIILGPPNYHDYQNQLRKLHSERFDRMPFEVFKSRVRIVRDEEVVKKWIDDQSWKTEYVCLNMPEPLRLGSKEAVEKHFREQHKDNIIKPVETYTLSGPAARGLQSPQLLRLVRQVWEDQRRFPLQIATVLSQQFAGHGLQFFKVNKTITHVSVARPHYLDLEATPVSEGVKRIVDYINANPKSTRRQLLQGLAPLPATAPAQIATESTAARPESPISTPEQTAIVADLHWLIHQGHVIEFANGTLETAKKPLPQPPKPEPKKTEPEPETVLAAPSAEPSSPATDATTPGAAAADSPDQALEQPREEPPAIEREHETPAPTEPAAAPNEEFRRPNDPPAATGEHHAAEPAPVPAGATQEAQPE